MFSRPEVFDLDLSHYGKMLNADIYPASGILF